MKVLVTCRGVEPTQVERRVGANGQFCRIKYCEMEVKRQGFRDSPLTP